MTQKPGLSPFDSLRFLAATLIASIFLLCGCEIAKIPLALSDGIVGTNLTGNRTPPALPKAHWTSAPGFQPESIPNIAVLTEDGAQNGRDRDSFAATIEDQFIQGALQKGYRVSSRSDVDHVLQEIRFQQSGLTERDAAKLGRMLNVPAVLIVRVTGAGVNAEKTGLTINNATQYNYTAWCDMSVRLISVEKGEILGLGSFSASRKTNNEHNRGPAMYFAATTLAAALPSRTVSKSTPP